MKKNKTKTVYMLIIIFVITISTTPFAEKPSSDIGNWTELFSGAHIISTSDGIKFEGEGYADGPKVKFAFINVLDYSLDNTSITIKFTDEMIQHFSQTENMNEYCNIVFASAPLGWFNSTPNITVFICPKSATKFKVILGGFIDGKWVDAGNNGFVEYDMPADKTIKIAVKKVDQDYTIYINDVMFDKATTETQKTLYQFKSKCYYMIGYNDENDLNRAYNASILVTDISGEYQSVLLPIDTWGTGIISHTTQTSASSIVSSSTISKTSALSTASSNMISQESEISSNMPSNDSSFYLDSLIDSTDSFNSSDSRSEAKSTSENNKYGLLTIILIVTLIICLGSGLTLFIISNRTKNKLKMR